MSKLRPLHRDRTICAIRFDAGFLEYSADVALETPTRVKDGMATLTPLQEPPDFSLAPGGHAEPTIKWSRI